MSNIVHIPEELKKEFRVNEKGETTCSIRGLARMLLLHHKTLSEHFSGGRGESFLRKTLIEQGFDVAALLSWVETGVPDVAIPTVAEYYAFDAKQVSNETRDAARKFIRATSAIGIRVWIQKELGIPYEDSREVLLSHVTSLITETLSPVLAKLDESNRKYDLLHDENNNLLVENVELTDYKEKVENYPEFAYLLDVAKSEIEPHEYLEGVSCREYILANHIPLSEEAWCTLSRRTASFYRSTKGADPKRRGSQTIYYNKDVAYIVATLRLIMKGL